MRPLALADLLSPEAFATQRQRLQAHVMAVKAPRRIGLGDHMTLLFENRDTVAWQIHEMCRVEKITRPEAVQGELDAYNPLIPGPGELSATLLIEYDDEAMRREMLVRLSGIDRALSLRIDGAAPVPARFEAGREREDTGKVSSVQFVRFHLDDATLQAFCDLKVGARFVLDHPAYQAVTPLTGSQRGALVEDLQAD